MNADVSLSQWEFDVLWSTMDAGPPPFPLRASVHGETIPEWERMRSAAYEELRARGLLGPRQDVTELLTLLTKPSTIVDVAGYADGPLEAVATAKGRDAVLATTRGDQIGLSWIRPTALVDAVVGELPNNSAGSGRSISVRHADVLRAVSDEDDEDNPLGDDSELDALVRNGISTQDAVQILSIAENRVSGGQIGVSVARRVGGLRRASVLATWFDTHDGRYLLVRDGEWMSIMPADSARIARRVQEILQSEVD